MPEFLVIRSGCSPFAIHWIAYWDVNEQSLQRRNKRGTPKRYDPKVLAVPAVDSAFAFRGQKVMMLKDCALLTSLGWRITQSVKSWRSLSLPDNPFDRSDVGALWQQWRDFAERIWMKSTILTNLKQPSALWALYVFLRVPLKNRSLNIWFLLIAAVWQ